MCFSTLLLPDFTHSQLQGHLSVFTILLASLLFWFHPSCQFSAFNPFLPTDMFQIFKVTFQDNLLHVLSLAILVLPNKWYGNEIQLQMLRNWFGSHMRETPLWPVLSCFIIVSGTFLRENQVSHVLWRHMYFYGKPTDSSLPQNDSDMYVDIFPAIVQVPPTFSASLYLASPTPRKWKIGFAWHKQCIPWKRRIGKLFCLQHAAVIELILHDFCFSQLTC